MESESDLVPNANSHQDVNFSELATEQIRHLCPNLDPMQTQLAIGLATLQIKSEHEAKLSRQHLQKTILDTVNTASLNKQNVEGIKNDLSEVKTEITQLRNNHSNLQYQSAEVNEWARKAYYIAAETKQKSSKGNFVVSGEAVPRQTQGENLINQILPLIQRKYGISVHPSELKAMHRLPNNRVLFSLSSRLPGQTFHKLVYAMNSNPRPELKVYVSIQLFELYAELFYLARRLKYYKSISNYRLDENGNTLISLKQETSSFKFTGLDQLETLGVHIPPEIYQEAAYRRAQIKENEMKSWTLNNEKAFKTRPNPPLSSQGQPQHSIQRNPYYQHYQSWNSTMADTHQFIQRVPSQQIFQRPYDTSRNQVQPQQYPEAPKQPPPVAQLNQFQNNQVQSQQPQTWQTPPYQTQPKTQPPPPPQKSGPPPPSYNTVSRPPPSLYQQPHPAPQPSIISPPDKRLRYDQTSSLPPMQVQKQYRYPNPSPGYQNLSPPFVQPQNFMINTPSPATVGGHSERGAVLPGQVHQDHQQQAGGKANSECVQTKQQEFEDVSRVLNMCL